MKIKYQIKEEDYRSFIQFYFFKRNLAMRLFSLVVLSIWIGIFHENNQAFIWSFFFLKAPIAFVVLYIITTVVPYIIAIVNLQKGLKSSPLVGTKTIEIKDDGIVLTNENESSFRKWDNLKDSDIGNEYLYVRYLKKEYTIVPMSAFTNYNEAIEFLGVVKNQIKKVKGNEITRRVENLYSLRYWGFIIPGIGAIIGIVLIINGLKFNKLKLITIGGTQILVTILVFKVISLIPENTNGFKDLSQIQLDSLVKKIEVYKVQNGQYPDSLRQLLTIDKFAPINDVFPECKFKKTIYYYYKKSGDKYALFSTGADGIPNTADDFYPNIAPDDSSKIGLIKNK